MSETPGPTLRVVTPVFGDTGPAELALSIVSVQRSFGRDDDLMFLVEDGDVAAVELIARHLGGVSDGPRLSLQRVAAVGAPGVLADVCESFDGNSPPDFVMFVHPGVEMLADAGSRIRDVASGDEIDVVYGDSFDNTPSTGPERIVLRPAWSPDRLRSQLDLGSLVAYRASMIAGWDPTSAHDLALIASERARSVAHIPVPLSRCSPASSGSTIVDPDAVARHLVRCELPMRVNDQTSTLHQIRLVPSVSDPASVSIIILTGGATRFVGGQTVLLVANALASVLVAQPDASVEIVVVLDANAESSLGAQLQALDPERIRIVRDTQPFNFSAANNLGVENATGEILLFLNDDVEVTDPSWIDRVRMHLADRDVGIVGGRLLFGDGRVQHAGLVARDGWIEHRFGGYPDDEGSRPALIENVVAVTGACLGISRSHFDELGGFPEEFPLNFNDVHLCFASAAFGRRVLIDHEMVLLHHETSSREAGITHEEQSAFETRWPERSQRDPYDHPDYVAVRAQPLAPPASLLRLRATLKRPAHDARIWTRP